MYKNYIAFIRLFEGRVLSFANSIPLVPVCKPAKNWANLWGHIETFLLSEDIQWIEFGYCLLKLIEWVIATTYLKSGNYAIYGKKFIVTGIQKTQFWNSQHQTILQISPWELEIEVLTSFHQTVWRWFRNVFILLKRCFLSDLCSSKWLGSLRCFSNKLHFSQFKSPWWFDYNK